MEFLYDRICLFLEEKLEGSVWCVCWYEVIFEVDMLVGRCFDLMFFVVILLSVFVVCLESVCGLCDVYGLVLYVVEWVFIGFFMVEYVMWLMSVW